MGDEEIPSKQIKSVLKQAQDDKPIREVEDQKWEGCLQAGGRMMRWIKDVSSGCIIGELRQHTITYEVVPWEEGQDA